MRKVHGRELKRSFGCTLGIPALRTSVCVCVCVGQGSVWLEGEASERGAANEITLPTLFGAAPNEQQPNGACRMRNCCLAQSDARGRGQRQGRRG